MTRSSRLLPALALAAVAGAAACGTGRSSPAPEKIIVSGASGHLGGMVVEDLLDLGVAPENLILVSRTPEELEKYARMGASTRHGDFTQPASLDTAYAGGDRILIISLNTRGNPNPRVASERPQLHQTAIDAAVRAGVHHIVYTSFVDAENNPSPIAVDHRLTEAMLKESGVAWTALRDQWYGDRLVGEAARIVASGRAPVDRDQEGTAFITRADCAAVAAHVLTSEGHENKIYEITGGELVTGEKLAATASEVAGVPIQVVDAGPDETPVAGDMDSGTTLTDDFFRITGRKPTSLRELLDANRDSLMRAAAEREAEAPTPDGVPGRLALAP